MSTVAGRRCELRCRAQPCLRTISPPPVHRVPKMPDGWHTNSAAIRYSGSNDESHIIKSAVIICFCGYGGKAATSRSAKVVGTNGSCRCVQPKCCDVPREPPRKCRGKMEVVLVETPRRESWVSVVCGVFRLLCRAHERVSTFCSVSAPASPPPLLPAARHSGAGKRARGCLITGGVQLPCAQKKDNSCAQKKDNKG